MVKLAAIADDLTGANDTALQFAKRNIKSCVKINLASSDFSDKDVVVIDSDSRDMSADEAYKKVKSICEVIKTYDAKCIYKKIDSTMRGNIGAEIKAVDDVFMPEIVMIAPAYPLTGRITVGGYHLLNGMPLEFTEIANAPKTPVNESYIPYIISQQAKDVKITILDLITMKKGVAALKNKINESMLQGSRWFICDIAKEENFVTLMDAVKSFHKILWVGSAGLADYITYFYDWTGKAEVSQIKRSGPALICAGSVSHVTQEQIKNVLEHEDINLVKVNIAEVLADEIGTIDKYVMMLKGFINREAHKNIIITTAQNDQDVMDAVEAGKQYGLCGKDVSEKVANIMAIIVSRLDLNKLSGLVMTGGDIAVHICRAIGAESIDIISEIDDAIPLGWIKGPSLDRLFVVTKAGAFGKPDAFIKSVKAIRNCAVDLNV